MMKPMAVTIIGGLIYGTILTLIVIPCIYDAFNKEKSMVEEEL
jgi:HAE1 family hydrophobic/amphiphilic exporter-1